MSCEAFGIDVVLKLGTIPVVPYTKALHTNEKRRPDDMLLPL